MKRNHKLSTIAVAVGFFTVPATAHVTFENSVVEAGKTAKFVLRIPHGCNGSPTVAIRISIPNGLAEVKPQPKSGWALAVVTDDLYEASADASGTAHTHGAAASVKEINWSGGRLEDSFYDEFAFRAAVSKSASGRIFVPVVQQCENGVERWIEIPDAGASSDDLKFPAPSVRVGP